MSDGEVERLARRARGGDPLAFEQLVHRLVRPALAAAWEFVPNREDAEDVVQDTFARAWRHLARYDTSRPFAPWFFTILRNVARNARRWDRRWSMVTITDDAVSEYHLGSDDPVDWIDTAGRIHEALEQLPPMQRACLRLTRIEGFDSIEVANMLGVSDATVRVHVHRARTALRARLGATRGEDS